EKAKGNVQAAAREARREAALAAAAELECERIVLGHTADDQVETMLYRLGRYGGLAAFRSMRANDPPWVRPLLTCRRAETAAFCREKGLEYAVDRGNLYPGYARTAIREQVLPVWEAALPGAVQAAARAAEVAAELEKVAQELLAGLQPQVQVGKGALSVQRLRELSPALRRLLLRTWLEERKGPEVTRAQVLAVESLLEKGGSVGRDIGEGWRAWKEYDVLWLEKDGFEKDGLRSEAERPTRLGSPKPAAEAPASQSGPESSPAETDVPLPVPGAAVWGDAVVRAEYVPFFCVPDPSREAYFDAAALVGPLVVRGPRPGDRLRPLGASGTRKLQDVLVDLKVPARRRARVPLVVCGDRVLWVCGLVRAEEGRITESTKTVVRLSVEWSRE
ncbi:MAG: tRNA lysidine(34) synthetase TilS, partial [Thermoleophilia bacterium]|nr:tRNA lysidine(34) synthetase TilS [Thermoleophilia bacterium]